MNTGWVAFDDVSLVAAGTESTVRRKTYSLAGQPIAVRVSGDPDGNDGLYYVHSDHLGSVHILTRHSNGYVEAGSLARYAPFGAWRTEPTTNPTLSGRGFTGHRHNNTGANDLGLIYMRARFYVPSIGRFASADTIVPDSDNPQSFNRYSYGFNNPIYFIDPTGHIACNNSYLPEEDQQACVDTTEPIWTRPFVDPTFRSKMKATRIIFEIGKICPLCCPKSMIMSNI